LTGLRAVLFDMGGTLFSYKGFEQSRRQSLQDLRSWLGIEADDAALGAAFAEGQRRAFAEFTDRPFYLHRDLFRAARRYGAMALGAAIDDDMMLNYERASRGRFSQAFRLRLGAHETLEELRRRGFYLGLVSNIDEDQLWDFVALGEFQPRFDSILSSEAARSCKPDSGIFLEALQRAGCAPHEAMYVGDTPDHDIVGAGRVGLRSVLIIEETELAFPRGACTPDHTIRELPELLELPGLSAAG
jgi:HAD superfamily hydrolase (TIGR01549 family)